MLVIKYNISYCLNKLFVLKPLYLYTSSINLLIFTFVTNEFDSAYSKSN